MGARIREESHPVEGETSLSLADAFPFRAARHIRVLMLGRQTSGALEAARAAEMPQAATHVMVMSTSLMLPGCLRFRL